MHVFLCIRVGVILLHCRLSLITVFSSPCVCVSRTLEEDVYRIALSLAKRYSVPLWEVYMTHLEFLFTDSGYTRTNKHTQTENKNTLT